MLSMVKLGNDATLKYARKKDTDNNLYEFVNLNLEQRAQAARKQYTQGMRSYGQRGDKVFDSRGVILNNNQIKKTYRYLSEDWCARFSPCGDETF